MQKNQGYPCILSIDIDTQSILQSDWMRTFWLVTCEAEFSQIWGSQRETENRKFFYLSSFQEKVMTKFYEDSRKFWTHLGAFLPIIGQANIFMESKTFLFLDFYH